MVLLKIQANVYMERFSQIHSQILYVTEFVKRGLIHASDFSTLRMCNSASVGPTALKFGGRTFPSL